MLFAFLSAKHIFIHFIHFWHVNYAKHGIFREKWFKKWQKADALMVVPHYTDRAAPLQFSSQTTVMLPWNKFAIRNILWSLNAVVAARLNKCGKTGSGWAVCKVAY